MRIATFLLCSALFACSTPRAPFHTEYTSGRITSVHAVDAGPPGPVLRTLAIATNGVFIPITMNVARSNSISYIYTLDVNRKTLLTQSNSRFNEGDCVVLWHPPLVKETSNQVYNFVAGTLESGHECR